MGQIIKLPTAARRQVKQRYNATLRAYRNANPWPGLTAFQREEAAKRSELAGLERNPELFCLLSILNALPIDVMERVQATADLLIHHAPNDEAARGGFALVQQAVAMRQAAAAVAAFSKAGER